MQTQTATFGKEIIYDRTTRDYAMYLEGELIGFARTYHEAEVTINNAIYDRIIHGDCNTAEELDGGCDDPPVDIPDEYPDPTPGGPEPPEWAFPTCEACQTNAFPPSSLLTRTCVSCANARYFGLANRFVAAQLATNEPPAEPPVDDGEDDNWGGFRRPRARTAIDVLIEQTMQRNRLCPNCGGVHYGWQCAEIRRRLFANEGNRGPAAPAMRLVA